MLNKETAHFYDFFLPDPTDASEEVELIQSLLPTGGSVLDIGAGVGRASAALAAMGYRVTALEPDAEMHAVMLARLAVQRDAAANITPLLAGFGFALRERFDACLALAVFHLLNSAQRTALFEYVAAHLKPVGYFVVESFPDLPSRTVMPRRLVAERSLGAVVYSRYISSEKISNGHWRMTWEYTSRMGEVELTSARSTYDWTTCGKAEITELARAAGFRIVETYSSLRREMYEEGISPTLLAILRKAP